jgi:hypothetical protein
MHRSGRGGVDEDDDLYSGYNDFPSALTVDDLEFDPNFQNSARAMDSRRPTALPSRSGLTGTAFGSRLGTAAGVQQSSLIYAINKIFQMAYLIFSSKGSRQLGRGFGLVGGQGDQ